jgi:uncharacterized protein YecT (DUF1311 family)
MSRPLLATLGGACLAVAGQASADPLATCETTTGDAAALEDCLDRSLKTSASTMNEALARARAVALKIDQATGREAAVLGVEASQHAWQAYRDTACQTWKAFVAGGATADAVALACMVEQTDRRREILLDLASSWPAP